MWVLPPVWAIPLVWLTPLVWLPLVWAIPLMGVIPLVRVINTTRAMLTREGNTTPYQEEREGQCWCRPTAGSSPLEPTPFSPETNKLKSKKKSQSEGICKVFTHFLNEMTTTVAEDPDHIHCCQNLSKKNLLGGLRLSGQCPFKNFA